MNHVRTMARLFKYFDMMILELFPHYVDGLFWIIVLLIFFHFSSRMWMKFPFLILWTLTRFSVPLKEKHPHYIIFQPQWFAWSTVFFDSYVPPDLFNVCISHHCIVDQKLEYLSIWPLPKVIHVFTRTTVSSNTDVHGYIIYARLIDGGARHRHSYLVKCFN